MKAPCPVSADVPGGVQGFCQRLENQHRPVVSRKRPDKYHIQVTVRNACKRRDVGIIAILPGVCKSNGQVVFFELVFLDGYMYNAAGGIC